MFFAGGRLLREARPVVLCEVSGQHCATVGHFLSECGYILFDAELPREDRRPLTQATWNTLAFPRECVVGGRRPVSRKLRSSVNIAVVILTFNKEQNIAQALRSICGWARQVFVMDSFSTLLCPAFPVTTRVWRRRS
jgi:hypothetical protein